LLQNAGVGALRKLTRAAGPSALAICAVVMVVDGCEWATTRSAVAQQAPNQTVSVSRRDQQQSRTDVGNAGRPVLPEYNGTTTKYAPTAAELDRRERALAARRREAGPPLRAGTPEAASGKAQPPPTDPPIAGSAAADPPARQ